MGFTSERWLSGAWNIWMDVSVSKQLVCPGEGPDGFRWDVCLASLRWRRPHPAQEGRENSLAGPGKGSERGIDNYRLTPPLSFVQSLSRAWLFARPHGLQHARLHCLLELTQTHVHRVGDGHPTVSSSAVPFSSCLQSSLASGSFPMSQLFAQVTKVLKLQLQNFSFSLSHEYSGLISLGFTGLIFLQSKGLPGVFSSITVWKHQFLHGQSSVCYNPHIHTWLLEKPQLKLWTFVCKVTSLLFNMLCRLVIAFLPQSKRLLNSWLQSPSTVILELRKIKSVTVSFVSPSICHEVMGPDAMIFVF